METEYIYDAILVQQTPESKPMVMFSASAVEIHDWAGIPQKKVEDSHETLGFQRGDNKKRTGEIAHFCCEDENVVQNPLLCAMRSSNTILLEREEGSSFVKVKIRKPDYSQMSLLDIMKMVKAELEERVPALKDTHPRIEKINDIKRSMGLIDEFDRPCTRGSYDTQDEEDSEDTDQDDDQQSIVDSILLEDETHIADFWEEVASRTIVLEEEGERYTESQILGFSKDAMISLILPVMIVDGQHRLLGSIQSARKKMMDDHLDELNDKTIELNSGPLAEFEIMKKTSRYLPISLLLNEDPAEHVFQFVVVNQKATPIGKALLGTIVSTTLSLEELERISDRLEKSGIPLEESRAITNMIRSPDSPFFNLVERGTTGENTNLLKWNVLGGLICIFRYLKGGKLFHDPLDYANLWKENYLDESEIVSQWENEGKCESKYDYWQSLNGPWKDVFITFWTIIRREFALNDSAAYSYWGNPRNSNLFNKISLTILASDFFQFLSDRGYAINNVGDIEGYMTSWLNNVDRNYFNRDWNLSGVKKDSTGIRKHWSQIWVGYRKNPKSLPIITNYRKPVL